MPHMCINYILYASVGSKILCTARKTTDLTNMLTRVNLLLIRMDKEGSECISII